MTMYQKNVCVEFFNTCPKNFSLGKNKSSLTIHLSSLLVKCVEDVACKSSNNNFYKELSDLIGSHSMQCIRDMYIVLPLLENYAKKSRNRFQLRFF